MKLIIVENYEEISKLAAINIKDVIDKNPNATVEECCRELDISKSSFSKYKALWKLQKDILKESK